MIGVEFPIRSVIVRMFAAKIEAAIRQGVIEETNGGLMLRTPRDIKWDMLVKRVGRFRVIAHCVEVGEAKPPPRPVQRAGALAEPKILFARLATQIVANGLAPPAKIIGLGWAVFGHGDPGVLAAHAPATGEIFKRNLKSKPVGFHPEPKGIGGVERKGRAAIAREIEAVAEIQANQQLATPPATAPAAAPVQASSDKLNSSDEYDVITLEKDLYGNK